MSKKYTLKETTQILKDIIGITYYNMEYLSKELTKLNLKQEDFLAAEKDDCSDELFAKVLRGRGIVSTLTILNSIVAPGHSISMQLFPKESHKFIENCMAQYKLQKEASINPLRDISTEETTDPKISELQDKINSALKEEFVN